MCPVQSVTYVSGRSKMQWCSLVLTSFLFAERGLQISHFAFGGTDWHNLF